MRFLQEARRSSARCWPKQRSRCNEAYALAFRDEGRGLMVAAEDLDVREASARARRRKSIVGGAGCFRSLRRLG